MTYRVGGVKLLRLRGLTLRECVSLVLMILPLGIVGAFVLLRPAVWSSDLAVFFSQDGELLRSDAGRILSALALAAALLCAWIGVLGTRDNWKANRRWQRGALGALAAVLVTLLLSSWKLTQAIGAGEDPEVGLAMFLTMCAILYGVVCAAVTPRDLVEPWYGDDEGY